MDEPEWFTISQLAQHTGLTIASIKFYIREDLLPPPARGRPRRAYYNEVHVKRLRLISALKDVAKLNLGVVKQVVVALDNRKTSTFELIAGTLQAITHEGEPPAAQPPEELADTLQEVDTFLANLGVDIREDNASRTELAKALSTIRMVYQAPVPVSALAPYAQAALNVAQHETDLDILNGEPEQALRSAILGTILWERVLIHLRRIMHEHCGRAAFRALEERKRERTQ